MNILLLIYEKKKMKMNYYALKYGFTEDKTVKTSQELDRLLNALHKYKCNDLLMKELYIKEASINGKKSR